PAYHIQTAENGRAALDALEWFRPDVVIMDIKMPELDGLELLRRVKTADPTIEVIMITAYASLETVKHALTNGAFEYLIKPFARQDLRSEERRVGKECRYGLDRYHYEKKNNRDRRLVSETP